MGDTYTRQSSYTDGDVITAAHTNDEFNQLLAAFAASSGHTHDGTTGEGGPVSALFSNTITLGANNDNDIVLTFDANTNNGVLSWKEDEDYFEFSDDILIASTEKIQFRDTGLYIYSSVDGQLDIVADTEVQIAATTIDINGAVDVSGNLDVGGNLTVTGTTTLNGGTLTLGDAATDNVVFGADVNSSIIPNTDNTYDLGSTGQRWKDAYVDGIAYIDTINFNGTAITSTAAELNIVDGDTSASAVTVVDADRVVLNDGGTMKQVAVTDLAAYFDDEITAMPNLITTAATTVGVLNSGSITSGFGTIDTGASAITTTGLISGGSLDIDSVLINGANIGHTDDIDLITLSNGVVTVAGELDAVSLDVSGDVDIDGTLEADAITINGITLSETIADTVGAMVTSNTETGITVAYDDADNTLDFTVGTLNQDTTGNAATATALETARTIGGTSFDGTANIAVGLADTATALATARTIGGTSFDGTANIAVGLATAATTVTVSDNESTNENNVILFGAGAAGSGNIGVEADGNMTYNPSTGKITATGFVGALTGDVTGDVTGNADTATLATTVTATANNTTAETVYLAFVDGATGTQGIETDTGLTWNPNTNVLTAANVAGTITTAAQNTINSATSLAAVGALNAGSITSGFGAIDNGASAITTTGAVGTGALTAGGLVTANANMLLAGTAPTLTIGDAGAEDAKIVFDGNAQDFHIGLDDTADDLVIGLGSALGTTPAISIDENVLVTIADDVSVVGRAFSPTLTTNLGSGIDLALGNNFLITTTGDVVLTFTNQIAGQSGTMKFVNDSNRAVTAHTNVAISEADLATISATGTYMVSYFVTAAAAANTILVSASAILT